MMHGHRKSDGPIVPEKSPNKGCFGPAEAVEEMGPTKGNSIEQNTPRTLSRAGVPSALDRIREAARKRKDERFTALYHQEVERAWGQA